PRPESITMRVAGWWQRLLGLFRRPPSGRKRLRRLYHLPRLEWLEERGTPHHDTLTPAPPLSFAAPPVARGAGLLNSANPGALFAVTLNAGDQVTADVNAQRQGSLLDAALRLFDGNGVELASNDNSNGLDPLLSSSVTASGTYYVGVSSSGNLSY